MFLLRLLHWNLSAPNQTLKLKIQITIMSEEQTEKKSPADELKNLISQLNEMEHYSRSNLEKLGQFWFHYSDEVKDAKMSGFFDSLLKYQNQFQDALLPLIEDLKEDLNQLNT
jgi:hypothetical protein